MDLTYILCYSKETQIKKLDMHLFHGNDRVHCIKQNSKSAASYFQNKRWQLINLLEQLSGFWPRQSKLQQYPLQLFHSFFLLTIISAVANKMREYVGVDADMTLECCLFMLFVISLFIKLIFASIGQARRRKVYERIAKHFETISDPEEVAVLNEGAERGFKYTLIYVCIVCVLVAIFDSVPVLQAFYDYFFVHGELILQLPLPMDFGFDHVKYWYIIALDYIIFVYSGILVDLAYDLAFMLLIRHVKALFDIVGIRLRKASELTDEFENGIMSDDAADEACSLVSSAIELHSECLKLVELIEECYTTSYFVILLLSTGAFGGSIHVISTKFHDPVETCRYFSVFMLVVMHFQVVFSRGQLIIDSAEGVSVVCYNCKWYRLPKKSSKLLLTMMLRTTMPCELTGAKLFILNTETFGKMLKAGLSYYTLFET